MQIKFNDTYELKKFVERVLFEGNKYHAFSQFENIKISVLFQEIDFDTDLDEFQVAEKCKKNKVKFSWICPY